MSAYFAVAYYKFITLEDPHAEVKKHKKFFEGRDVAGRIYLSEEGINGQMSGKKEDVYAYIEWMNQDPRFEGIHFKLHEHHENIFARMSVKYRKQLVALDWKVDLRNSGEHLSPKEWKETLENEDVLLIDVRNDYEWEIGHFDKATLPPLETFRQFPEYAEKLKEEVDPKTTKVLMYCTGGIRCELYSALMKEKGFEKVYQLQGGVINYGLEEGHSHWKGKLFVFDDRLAVPIAGEEIEPISHCYHCHLPSDTYYNCANMDCNYLFLACPSCIETYQGCCSHPCKHSPRVRPFQREGGNKPFRRKHLINCATDESHPEGDVECDLSTQSNQA